MNDKVLNTLYIAALIVVIGVMSWRDMHPKVSTNPSRPITFNYYVGPDITLAMIPDDSTPLTIGLGTFSYTRDGKTSWTPQGLPPTTIAQRQINLQYHFNSMPHNPEETIKIIKATVDDWVHKGDMVNTLLFDYDAGKPDLKAYADLVASTHEALKKNSIIYVIYSGIDLQWAEGPQKDALKYLHDNSPQFLIHVPKAPVPPEMLSKLAALKYDFTLQFPAGTQRKDLHMDSLQKLDSLAGITLTLDPHKPLPKKDDQVGLFPKL